MDWNEIKNNPDKLQDAVDKYGVRGLARKVGVSHPTVLNYLKKEGQEEVKPAYEKTPTGYVVYYGKKYKVAISEEQLEELLSLYCVAKLTLNQVALKTGFTRKEVYAIKTAFSITKDSQPFTPEQVNALEPEEIAERIRIKKLRYSLQIYEANKYADIETRVKQMDKAHFWYSELCRSVNKITPKPYKLAKRDEGETITVAYVADVHAGLEVDNYFNRYNIDIMHERFAKLASELACSQSEEIIICDLGDTVHGIIHGSVQKYSTWVTDATTEVIKAYEQLFLSLLEQGYKVSFAKVNGSHESIEKVKTDRTEEENLGNFIYDMLKWKYSEFENLVFIDKIHGLNATIIPIYNYSALLIHGDNNSLNMIKDADRVFRGYNIKEVNAGHIHHRKVEDMNGLEVHFNEAFCGTDQYAGNKLLDSERGTRIVTYTREGRESERLARY